MLMNLIARTALVITTVLLMWFILTITPIVPCVIIIMVLSAMLAVSCAIIHVLYLLCVGLYKASHKIIEWCLMCVKK